MSSSKAFLSGRHQSKLPGLGLHSGVSLSRVTRKLPLKDEEAREAGDAGSPPFAGPAAFGAQPQESPGLWFGGVLRE